MMPILPMVSPLIALFTGAGPWAALAEGFRGFAHSAAPIAVTAMWQGALVAAGLALCMRFAPRVAAVHRFAAWAAGFLVLVALPFVPALARVMAASAVSNIGTSSLGSPASRALLGHAGLAHPWLRLSDSWCMAIAALWLVMALLRAADLINHSIRLRRLWKSATPALPAFDTLEEGSGNGARRRRFEICTTRELDRPSVIGFFAPRILIPGWLLGRLTRQELEQVVMHEAEHLRRHDDWTNLLQKLCLVVFPLNPGLMFVERRLCREREMACDEGVVRRTQAPRAYAACLAGLAERHMERRAEALSLGARAKALTLSAYERRPELARRVHSILVRRSAMHPVASLALVGAVGCALAAGAVALARCPQLVAYVPAESRLTAETAQMVPPSLQPSEPNAAMASHFSAINAMAIMPEATQRNANHCRASLGKAATHARELKPGPAAISALTAKATQTDPVAEAAKYETPAPQELIVLTAYEQVQADGEVLGDRVISDYDSGVASSAQQGHAGTGRITITQLIFRVYPASQQQARAILTSATKPGEGSQTDAQSGMQPAAQSSSAATGKPAGPAMPRGANSLTSLPHAVALGNGWFVIQL